MSVMNNNDYEPDRRSDVAETNPMVPALDFIDSGPGKVATNGDEGARVNLRGSEGIRVLNGDIFGAEEVRVPMEVEGEKVGAFDGAMRVDEEMGPRAGDVKNEANRIEPRVERSRVTSSAHGKRQGEMGKSSVSEYDSMLSKFDEFAAAGPSRPLGYGFEIGDMVWGKVKSHPWWPGHIYSEAFATPSVRRSKREGHVLVAFFGDSSYGWFDPAELVAFDPNYAEKSRQTNSRTFVKAVEEAVDEASRRRALGLACRCRNPYNFRPTDVQGYFAVDVGDYEPGTVYSANLINKARDSFQSKETLAFVKQLALTPTSVEHEGIHFIKNRATVLAYRKAVYEEFDETYAQAFGHQPVRPARPTQDTIQQPSRAPLSGPLVIAEALGKGKSSAKSTKVKDQPKKEKYLFKRRENTNSPKEASSAQPVFVEGSSAIADGNFVLQKRAPAVPLEPQIPATQEQTKILGLGRDLTGQEALTTEEKLAVSNFSMASSQTNASKVESAARSPADQAPPGYSSHPLEAKPSALDKGKAAVGEMKERLGSTSRDNPGIVSDTPYSIMVEPKDGRPSSAAVKSVEGFDQVQDGSMTEDKIHGGGSRMLTDNGAKKTKARKRPREELNAGKSVLLQKKRKKELMSSSTEKSVLLEKKKKKKALMSSDTMQMRAIGGKSGASASKEAGKSVQLALAPREDLQVDHQKKGDPASTSLLPGSVQTEQMAGRGQVELELPQLLSDLRALALNPFHDVERRSAFIRKVFLRFRSLVYQKSIASLPLSENESNETRASKSPTVNAGYESPPGVTIRDLPSSKAQKPPFRPDDPTKGGRKRGPSDRQEEIALKKKKKLSDLKLLTTEKKVVAQKAPEVPRVDNKEPVAPKGKLGKPGSVKKPVPLARSPEPTMLVMKFPPGATLPSLPELKARFARFGPLDPSALRVFWQSLTCRVVFRYKEDAQAALRFVEGSNNLFGSTNVRCSIRESGVAALESDSSKVQREDASVGTQSRDSAVEQRPAAPFSSQLLQQPGVQLKSCLKKSNGEEIGSVPGGNGGGKGTPRVKFMLGGEDSRNNFNNNNNNANFADGGASSSSSHAMEIDSKNFQKVVTPPPSLPVPPLPTVQLSRPPNNLHYADTVPRNAYNFNTPNAPHMPSVDIGQQMLSLLTRCNDVVTNVTGMLGYVPYHPL
ncbi:hypothetical protein RJ640_024763 [Escallonia rubra]|uniref:PWWP domain-containing protein n=1 Tax=Escallonia rubra TaxID=112253 RepID=A0AA88QW16_9ASTE|nr:hypothetical protein RJ640_024763 [Escallonia rubra]